MYEATVILYDCIPLRARLTRKGCAEKHERALKVRKRVKVDRDYEGGLYSVEACVACKGVKDPGESITVNAGPPTHRVAVPGIYGGYGYVG